MVQVTYQKANGCVIQKFRNTMLPYKIGETTSMGWKVLNIEYEYKNKYYPEYQYNILIKKDKKALIRKQQTLDTLKKESKTFLYYFIAILIVNLLKSVLGI